MPENEKRSPDDIRLDDCELEELFVAAGKCAKAGRVLKRIRELSFDDDATPDILAGTPTIANRDAADLRVCQSPGIVVPNDEK